jgi:hypothetical protein
MTFEELLDQAIDVLQRRGRVIYRTLSIPMISLSPPSRRQSEVFWSHAIRLIFSVSLVLRWRTGRDHKPC